MLLLNAHICPALSTSTQTGSAAQRDDAHQPTGQLLFSFSFSHFFTVQNWDFFYYGSKNIWNKREVLYEFQLLEKPKEEPVTMESMQHMTQFVYDFYCGHVERMKKQHQAEQALLHKQVANSLSYGHIPDVITKNYRNFAEFKFFDVKICICVFISKINNEVKISIFDASHFVVRQKKPRRCTWVHQMVRWRHRAPSLSSRPVASRGSALCTRSSLRNSMRISELWNMGEKRKMIWYPTTEDNDR